MKNLFVLLLVAAAGAIKISGPEEKVTYGERVTDIPGRFEGPESDRLMNSIIGKYSQEKFIDGKPTGEFSLDKSAIQSIAREVVETHVKPKEGVEKYLEDRLPQAWERADVNKTGRVEAGRIPMVLREVVADPVLGFGLQM